MQCAPSISERRSCFWATQPCGCGSSRDRCGRECCDPGWQMANGQIATEEWIRGLMLNMLNTDKRVADSACGVNPAGIKGHWSESFIDGETGLYGGANRGYRVGTALRQIDTSTMTIREIEAQFSAELTATMQKLVLLGVVQSVNVTVAYTGNHTFAADIIAYGPNNAPYGKVAILGQRDETAGFYWSC